MGSRKEKRNSRDIVKEGSGDNSCVTSLQRSPFTLEQKLLEDSSKGSMKLMAYLIHLNIQFYVFNREPVCELTFNS